MTPSIFYFLHATAVLQMNWLQHILRDWDKKCSHNKQKNAQCEQALQGSVICAELPPMTQRHSISS